jgi:hypothetical protein
MVNFCKLIFIFVLLGSLSSCAVKHEYALSKVVPDRFQGDRIKILIPLYSYPNWYAPDRYIWREVIAAAQKVPIVAVINPNNGPDGDLPNQDYQKGLNDLRKAGITILGYVYTKYGDRPLSKVKYDIDLYSRHFDVDGIFFDEAASSKEKINYYQQLYQYTKSQSKLKTVVLNQGTSTDEIYLQKPATDIAVTFENYGKAWLENRPRNYIDRYQKNRFSALIHTVADPVTMKKYIDRAVDRNIGYVYITDDSPDSSDRDPWNSLPSYWQEEVDYIYSLNFNLF